MFISNTIRLMNRNSQNLNQNIRYMSSYIVKKKNLKTGYPSRIPKKQFPTIRAKSSRVIAKATVSDVNFNQLYTDKGNVIDQHTDLNYLEPKLFQF